jgi:hypothetical protein
MLRRLVGTAVALLLVVGVTLAADTKPKRGGPRAFGKITKVDLKNGVGTITVLGKASREGKAMRMTFKVTKNTKFAEGQGRGKKPTPVSASKVASTFKKGTNVFVTYEKKDDEMMAKMVVKFRQLRKDD